jgi:uncharacterized protein (TIGR03086 family)
MPSDAAELYRRACLGFGERVHAVRDDQWHDPTPCADWDVRVLVNHLVNEDRWAVPLFAGKTMADVGDALDGDLLGADPKAAWDDALKEALDVALAPGAPDRTVHLSFGETPASEYLMQLFADHLVHGWDLAKGIGADTSLDPELVQACLTWFEGVEEMYRQAGAIADRPPIPDDADPQTRLLAAFGRSEDWTAPGR